MWRWLTVTVKPWLWRPRVSFKKEPWYWSLGVEPYIDWAPGYHFDGFGAWFRVGPYSVDVAIRDNN